MSDTILLENLRGMCAFRDPDGRACDRVRTVTEFCTACFSAMRIDELQAQVRLLEAKLAEAEHCYNLIETAHTELLDIEADLRAKLAAAEEYADTLNTALNTERLKTWPEHLRAPSAKP